MQYIYLSEWVDLGDTWGRVSVAAMAIMLGLSPDDVVCQDNGDTSQITTDSTVIPRPTRGVYYRWSRIKSDFLAGVEYTESQDTKRILEYLNNRFIQE